MTDTAPPALKVVQLHDTPPLNDIPAQLRQLAEMIENKTIEPTSVLVVVPEEDAWPMIFGWGNIEGHNDPIIQFELAKQFFINNLVERCK